MKILIIGNGGREHALTWTLAKDPDTTRIYAAPGNPGIAEIATPIPIESTNIKQLATFATKENMELTIVGPEAPLAAGITDQFHKQNLTIFGPNRQAAQIESSKSFAKTLCAEHSIPTPQWETHTRIAEAKTALDRLGPPWVVKADGLAGGKGTIVTGVRGVAESAIHSELAKSPGRVVLEEFVDGWESSFTATVSGGRVQWLAPVFQDYKPIFDNDAGPNTGGMGVYSPVPQVSSALVEKVRRSILEPAVRAMSEKGIVFQGVLYLNVMVPYSGGDPMLLEFNARFGDPEAQGIAPLIRSGFLAHVTAIAENSEHAPLPKCSSDASVVVVLASKGYPTQPSTGEPIGIGPITQDNVLLFQAGTARNPSGELVTAGGRVLNVVATAPSIESARKNAYSVIGKTVEFPGMQYRHDIGSGTRRSRLDVIDVR